MGQADAGDAAGNEGNDGGADGPDSNAQDEVTAAEGVQSDPTTERREYDPDRDHCFPDGLVNEVLDYIDADPEVQAYMEAQNVNPVVRKGYNDHGPEHVKIARNRALCLYELLKDGGVAFNGARDHGLDEEDEAVIVALATTFHDIGHVVHRHRHPYYSVPLAADLLDRILPEFYDPAEVVKLRGEVLHAIICHHTEETPLTREAGVVRVADALDMERGRSRNPYERGGRGINTLSSQAIQRVSLHPGDDVAVQVEIEMTNAAGVYQVDSLLKAKLKDSMLEDHVRIVALNVTENDHRLVERIEL
jgi:metal-dependent HD superfamily phosphatase/phosphodiesterase